MAHHEINPYYVPRRVLNLLLAAQEPPPHAVVDEYAYEYIYGEVLTRLSVR